MNPLDLDSLTISRGKHASIQSGACLMELVAYVNGEPWTDLPRCVSPLLAAFCRSLNDTMEDAERQKLKELIPILSGTNTGRDDDQKRGMMCADWIIRTYTPAWLALAGLTEHAEQLRSISEITTGDSLIEAIPALVAARTAARDAAGTAIGTAARDAARDAAWYSARTASMDAGSTADFNYALDYARKAAWAAAVAASKYDLNPTVISLRSSAIELAKRMANVGRIPLESP